MSLGGVTQLQRGNQEKFLGLQLAENGIFGSITLKSSVKIFSVIDVILGALYVMFLLQEVIFEWSYFNLNGPHFALTAFYFLRVLSLPSGVIGAFAVNNQSVNLSKIYCYFILFEGVTYSLLGVLSSYDMCHSYVYYEPCKDIWV